MKKLWILCLLLTGLTTECGSNSKPAVTGTQLTGTWNVTVNQSSPSGQPSVTLSAFVVGGPCQVQDSTGDTFTVQGPSCVLADDQAGQGHVSSQNSTLVPEGVLLGSPANPAANGASVNFLYASKNSATQDWYVFQGSGVISNGQISGSWSCYPNVTICSGWTGTFTATQ